MISGLKPYPAYKDSGVEWLGKVPEYWRVQRLKTCVENVNDVPTGVSHGVAHLALEHIESWTGRIVSPGESPFDSQAKRFVANDVLFGKLRPYLAKVTRPQSEGVCVSEFFVLRSLKQGPICSSYLEHLLRSKPVIDVVDSTAFGARMPRASWQSVGGLFVPVPTREEQTAIVRYLDHVDRRIRRYIRSRRKLISLLNEQKQAIINKAVTRGLNPDVRLKPSGVDWLGDVPEHWQVCPLKHVAWFKSGAGFPVSEQGREEFSIPFYRVSDMNLPGNEKMMNHCSSTVSPDTARRLRAFVFPANTIIFPKVGGALLTNKRRILTRPSCIDNNLMGCVFRCGDLDYCLMLLECLDLGRLAKPGPVPAISEGEVRQVPIAFPPIDEQSRIAAYVTERTEAIEKATKVITEEIALMREYRTRLISDVVTGKLDVRALAAQLCDNPDEQDESDWIEDAGDDSHVNETEGTAEIPEGGGVPNPTDPACVQ